MALCTKHLRYPNVTAFVGNRSKIKKKKKRSRLTMLRTSFWLPLILSSPCLKRYPPSFFFSLEKKNQFDLQ